ITSPYHLYAVESLRTKFNLRTCRKVETDVFVFGRGEPARRDCTKVGGVPYWPSSRSWPVDSNGTQYHFLAQINFSDSLDLVGPVPADMLLILAEAGDAWSYDPTKLRFECV